MGHRPQDAPVHGDPRPDDIERAHLRDPADRTHVIVRQAPSEPLRPWIRRFWIPSWDVPLTVEQLCGRFGIGERALQRLTARRLGLSPARLIRRRRLHEAAGGLRGPEPAADLAARLGYADQAHFSRDFRASTGLTPGEFSRRWREEG